MRYREHLKLDLTYRGLWTAIHHRDARLLHVDRRIKNALLDAGEENILDVYFRGATPPTSFKFGLGNGTVPAETVTTVAGITEVSGTGYAQITVNRNTTDFPTLTLDSGDYEVRSATKTFSATGTWTAADFLFLTENTSTDLLVAVALSTQRTLVNGDTLDVSMDVKLA